VPIIHADLHGNAPDKSGAALVLIDFINDLEFEEGETVLKTALPAAQRVLALKQRARDSEIPVIYVNDNFGRWRSDFNAQVDHCLQDDVRGRPLAEILQPEEDDYFVLKPKHSGFYSTSLDVLLSYLGVCKLVITGFAGDICVLYTANDAYMRDFELIVPADCIASETTAANRTACRQMKRFLRADVRSSRDIRLKSLL